MEEKIINNQQEENTEVKQKKPLRKLKIFGIVVGTIAALMLTINIIPPAKVIKDNPFIAKGDLPMLAAHRGGSINDPENTLKAYRNAVKNYNIDIVESDLWLTKDGKLVYNHDSSINRTSDVEEITGSDKKHYVSDYTLEELQNFNFGYDFKDENGNYPYRSIEGLDGPNRKQVLLENGLQIVEVGQLFSEFYTSHPELLFIVEIKNKGEEGIKACQILDQLLTDTYPNYKNQVVVGTFHDEIEKELKDNHPSILRGASTGAAAGFIITEMLKVNLFDFSSFACLQIPMSYDIMGIELNLDQKQYINRAHRRNIAVQYWTINEEEDMRHLIDLGCDAIMTDNPKLLREVLNSYK